MSTLSESELTQLENCIKQALPMTMRNELPCEARAALKRLVGELRQATVSDEWFACATEMPEDEASVWLYQEGWVVTPGYRELGYWRHAEGFRLKGMKPTHWRPHYVQPTPPYPKVT